MLIYKDKLEGKDNIIGQALDIQLKINFDSSNLIGPLEGSMASTPHQDVVLRSKEE